jgi:hypothetical protein
MAKFEKGHPKIGGIEKGGKHAKTKAWEALGAYLVNELAAEYMEWLKTLQSADKAKQFQIMIEYFRPRLQRSQVEQETTVNDLRTFPKHMYIGYTDEEELRLRREDDKIHIKPNELPGKFHINYRDAEEETEIPGSVPMPKIHIKRDPD